METIKLLKGDNMELLKKLEDNSIDSVVTDPPYGLSFMNKKWDYNVPSVELWKEVLRVLKPGGHVLSFGGTRTYHRMVVNMEDAGFEIRDSISYMYGSGFPKSHNIGKAVDKRGGESIGWFGEWLKSWREQNNIPQSKIAELFPSKTGGLTGCVSNWELGNNLPTNEQFNLICETFNLPFNSLEEAEREFIGTKTSGIGKAFTKDGWGSGHDEVEITKGNSEWEGWGTALKPSMELICLARKPLSEKSIAENVLKHGTGGINIEDCRIGTTDNLSGGVYSNGDIISNPNEITGVRKKLNKEDYIQPEGRFPANTILECICDEVIPGEKGEKKYSRKGGLNESDFSKAISPDPNFETAHYKDKGDIHTNPECPCYILDKQSGVSKSVKGRNDIGSSIYGNNSLLSSKTIRNNTDRGYEDKGGASRYFYTAKVSKKERNMGLDETPDKILNRVNSGGLEHDKKWAPTITKNNHPTVKPVNLMTYLCRLITPPNGVVLDMYMGSGSTGISALLEGFKFVGMEMDDNYFNIAEARINNFEQYRQFIKK